MAVLIVRLGDNQYVKWSNTVDAPVSCVLGRNELIRELESEDRLALSQAACLVDAADDTGTSDPAAPLDALLASNRAGPGESQLSLDEIVRQYQGTG